MCYWDIEESEDKREYSWWTHKLLEFRWVWLRVRLSLTLFTLEARLHLHVVSNWHSFMVLKLQWKSQCLHRTFLGIFQEFSLHSVWGPPYLGSIYSSQATQFCVRILDCFHIHAVSLFLTVDMTNETVSFWKRYTSESFFKKKTWFQCQSLSVSFNFW